MTTISKDAILAADDLPTENVDCPEWGGTVTVRTMTQAEYDDFEAALLRASRGAGKIDPKGLKVRMLQLTILNGDGSLLFSADDIPALEAKSSRVINRLADVAFSLNGVTKRDQEELLGN